jgi:general secretion pathway protein D
MRDPNVRRLILLLVLLATVAGCATYEAARQADIAARTGRWDDAVLYYMKAVEQEPDNLNYRASLLRAKIESSRVHFEKGQEFEKAGVLERALVEYQQAVQLDATNQYAKARLERTRQAYTAQRQNRGVSTIDQMKEKARAAQQPPRLNPRSNQPIDLEVPEPRSIFEIYHMIGDAFGINILFDPNLKDQELSIDLKQVTAQSALETLIRTAGHFYKVMDDHTIIVAQDTPQNRRIYEDLVIQTFFLSNAEVKDMMTILRSLVDAKKIAVNEQLNAIILRDTADKVKVAERIIEANDKSKAEVVVDVELLQIDSGKLRDIGASLADYTVTQTLDVGAGSGTGGTAGSGTGGSSTSTPIRLSDIEFLNQSNWILTIPNFIYNFIKRNTDAQILAKPQIRITDGEKANLTIGDRVPIPLTTFNTQNVGGQGGIIPITSFQYQDVGIRIDIEPRVHHNGEVTLKLKVEVSNINGFVEGSGGQRQPTIGTRSIESVIRLQDGETNFLAGLIRTSETDTDTGFPGLSEIPVLGRLFSNKRTEHQRTDVILTLTPHIIRNAQITEDDLLPIWVGTEANVSFRGGSPRVESDVDGPFEGNEGTPEEIQDAIRRRIQRLPRGLRPGEIGMPDDVVDEGGGEQEPPQPPAPPTGIELVPAAPPTDIFRPPAPAQPPPDEEPPGGGGTGGDGSDVAQLQDSTGSAVPETSMVPSADTVAAKAGPALASQTAPTGGTATAASRATGAPVKLWLAPQRLEVSAGDRFEVLVQVSAGQPVSHLPLSFEFDPKVLAVDKVEAGDFLGGEGKAQVMSDFRRPGALVLGASRIGQVPGVQGSGTVARITFRALAKGSTRIGFVTGKALDATLRPVPLTLRPAQVEVHEAAPEPPTATLAPVPREASPSTGR